MHKKKKKKHIKVILCVKSHMLIRVHEDPRNAGDIKASDTQSNLQIYTTLMMMMRVEKHNDDDDGCR